MTYQEPEKNYTKIPNPILDVMGEMSESELKLTMCLVRYTFGYHTDRAQMTYEIMQERTGMSRGGVYRAIELVEERGFFRRGRKSFWYVNSSKFELCYVDNNVGNSSDSERKYAGNSSDSEPTKRKVFKNIETTATAREAEKQNDYAIVFYENNIGGITPRIADWVLEAVDEFGEKVVIEAMDEAVLNNVRRWKYIAAILDNWKQNGRIKPSKNGHKVEKTFALVDEHGNEIDKVVLNV